MSNISEVKHFFDGIAPRYEGIVGGNGWPPNDILREELTANRQRVDLALDLGGGTGLSTKVTIKGANPRHVVVVDVSKGMLEQLPHFRPPDPIPIPASMAIGRFLAGAHFVFERERLRNRSSRDPRSIAARWAIGQCLARPQSRFDLVTAIGLLHFLPEPQTTISGVARILNNGGRFMFTYDPFIPGHPIHGEEQTTYDLTVYRKAPEDIEASLRQSGLEMVSDRSFVAQPNGNTDYLGRFVVARKLSHYHPSVGQE